MTANNEIDLIIAREKGNITKTKIGQLSLLSMIARDIVHSRYDLEKMAMTFKVTEDVIVHLAYEIAREDVK